MSKTARLARLQELLHPIPPYCNHTSQSSHCSSWSLRRLLIIVMKPNFAVSLGDGIHAALLPQTRRA
eukprot:2411837-Pyramimonas_sp.AAC.2